MSPDHRPSYPSGRDSGGHVGHPVVAISFRILQRGWQHASKMGFFYFFFFFGFFGKLASQHTHAHRVSSLNSVRSRHSFLCALVCWPERALCVSGRAWTDLGTGEHAPVILSIGGCDMPEASGGRLVVSCPGLVGATAKINSKVDGWGAGCAPCWCSLPMASGMAAGDRFRRSCVHLIFPAKSRRPRPVTWN